MSQIDNVQYQQRITKDNYTGCYQGDVVSKILINLIKKYIEAPVLDIGAGSGSLVNTFKKRGLEAVGIDLPPVKKGVLEGNITDLNFADNDFKTIFCTEVLEHLDSQQLDRGIDEVRRVLKPGGHFIVTVPYNENLDGNSYTCPQCKYKFHRMGHLQSFDKDRIKNILKKGGFKILYCKVFPLGVIAKLPLGRWYYKLFMKLKYDLISKTMIIVAEKN